VAKIPEPITREMQRMYALLHDRFLPEAAVSGKVLSSVLRLGLVSVSEEFASREESDVEDEVVEVDDAVDMRGSDSAGELERLFDGSIVKVQCY